MPKFRDLVTWQQAEVLMQPAFIRLIDNIRKQLDESDWKGTYEDVQVWPEGTSEETKTRVMLLRQQLEEASAEQTKQIEHALTELPSPYPGYLLCLERREEKVCVDLWNLCYQICFQDYDAGDGTSHHPGQAASSGVEVDMSLFDETGDVDWNRLDDKTQRVVEQVFANLPQ